jgi:hypothetical protein
MALRQDISLDLQETWIINIACTDDQGAPLDLTNGNVRFRLEDEGTILFDLDTSTGIIITNPSAGLANVTITKGAQISASIVVNQYQYEVQTILANGVISDQVYGALNVTPSLFAI